MNRASFLHRMLGLVAALTVAPKAEAADSSFGWGSSVADPIADNLAWNEHIVASGGLCAPVTPFYGLQYLSVPSRPVMGALPSFNADRGGLRYARPAGLDPGGGIYGSDEVPWWSDLPKVRPA